MDIQTKDGILLRGIPEGTPDEAIKARIAKIRSESSAPDPSEGGLPFSPFGVDTGLTMPQGVSRFMAAAGQAPVNFSRGIRQLAGEEGIQQEIDQAKELEAPLMRTGAGMAGNIAGNAAMFAPTAFIPGVNTYTGAAALGTGLGAMQPVATGDSRGANALLGGGAGVAGQAAGNALGRLLRPVASKLGPEEATLAAAAQREGIPLTAGQATGSRPLQITESVMENLPMTSGSQLAGREAQQRAFTAAALRRAGMAGDSAQAGALLAQKNALGGQIGDIAKRNALAFDDPLTSKIVNILDDAQTHLPPDQVKKVAGTVDQIMSQVEQSGSMLGTNYQGWREPLRALASEGGATGRIYSNLRKALGS